MSAEAGAVRAKAIWRGLAWSAAALVLAASLAPLPSEFGNVPQGSDKLVHIVMYATLTALFARAYRALPAVPLGLALLCYGAIIEAAQHLLTTRSGSLADAIANGAGILIILSIVALRPDSRTAHTHHDR